MEDGNWYLKGNALVVEVVLAGLGFGLRGPRILELKKKNSRYCRSLIKLIQWMPFNAVVLNPKRSTTRFLYIFFFATHTWSISINTLTKSKKKGKSTTRLKSSTTRRLRNTGLMQSLFNIIISKNDLWGHAWFWIFKKRLVGHKTFDPSTHKAVMSYMDDPFVGIVTWKAFLFNSKKALYCDPDQGVNPINENVP